MTGNASFFQSKEISHYPLFLAKTTTKSNQHAMTQSCIFSTNTCFVCKQIGDPAQLLRDGARANHSTRDFGISADHPAVHNLPHVQIHSQTAQEEREKRKIKSITRLSLEKILVDCHSAMKGWVPQWIWGAKGEFQKFIQSQSLVANVITLWLKDEKITMRRAGMMWREVDTEWGQWWIPD